MRLGRLTCLAFIILLNLILLFSAGCFAGNMLNSVAKDKKAQDYTHFSQKIDEKINFLFSDFHLGKEAVSKGKIQHLGRNVPFQSFQRVVWNYQEEKVIIASPNVNLPELALRLESQLHKSGGKILKSVWEENAQYKTLIVQVGFLLQEKNKTETFVTHNLNIRQRVVKKGQGKIALIIDDFGAMMPGTSEMMSIKRHLTFAILPYRSSTAKEAQMAVEKGFQVMLHLPMEPLNPKLSAGPYAIKAGMKKEEVAKLFKQALAQVPQAKGVNNHMGSKATEDMEVVITVLEQIKEKNLFFVDSHTSPKSVIAKNAINLQVPYVENYLFIDNIDNVQAVKKEIQTLAKIALTKGNVVGIGHVRKATAQAIEESLPELDAQGIDLVYVSELVKK